MAGKRAKWIVMGLILLVVVIVGGVVAFRMAVGILKTKVVAALGPGSEISALRVGWSAVEVDGLRIKGPQGWPTADTLRAEQVVIVPSLRSLFTSQVQVASITIHKPYLSILRTREGKVRVVPSLLEGPAAQSKAGAGPPARSVKIGQIVLQDGVVELYDATVAQPPLKDRIEQIQATVRDVIAPSLTGKTEFDVTGVLKGVQRDGTLNISGWANVATKDSAVKTQLRTVDLVALQPYLSRETDTRLERGLLDLDLDSEVKQNRLHAPGHVVLSNLEFAPAHGAMDTFLGVPRTAVVSFLKNKDNQIAMNFVLEGDINNPHFTLNEALSTRLASSLAESLGVSIRGLAEGVGSLGQKSVEAAGEAAKGVGGALQQLFGGKKKR